MRLTLFALLFVSFVGSSALADPRYRCEDIPWFEHTLNELRTTCGTPPPAPGVCRALGFIGSTPEAAIEACAGPNTPYSRQQCGNDLTCPQSITYCRANGYVGSTPGSAVAACAGPNTPYNASQCGAALTCQGNVGYFEALGYIGDTPEAAINACAGPNTPHSRQQCSAAVQCRGSDYFCQNWTFTLRALRLSADRF